MFSPEKAHLESCIPPIYFFFLLQTKLSFYCTHLASVHPRTNMGDFSGGCTSLPHWIQRFVPTQLWVAQGPRKGGRLTALMHRRGLAWGRASENLSPSITAYMLLSLVLSSERFLLRKLTKFSVLLERRILNSVSSFRILSYECD